MEYVVNKDGSILLTFTAKDENELAERNAIKLNDYIESTVLVMEQYNANGENTFTEYKIN